VIYFLGSVRVVSAWHNMLVRIGNFGFLFGLTSLFAVNRVTNTQRSGDFGAVLPSRLDMACAIDFASGSSGSWSQISF
jgi:hypothetical protein